MPARHRSRQRATQVLYLWDIRRQPLDEVIDSFYASLSTDEEDEPKRTPPDDFMETLVRGAAAKSEELDRLISLKSEHWRIDRMPTVDRNILRLAIYEMRELGTPAAVVINEALELARQFSGDESVAFVNGILDAVNKEPAPPKS